MAYSPFGIDPSLIPMDQYRNNSFLTNLGKPTFMQPSPGVPYRMPQQGPETKLPQPTLSDVYAKTHFIPSPQEGFDDFYSVTGAPGSQPKLSGSQSGLSDVLGMLSQQLSSLSFGGSATTTTTAETAGPQMPGANTVSPSLTTTTNPNIGIK